MANTYDRLIDLEFMYEGSDVPAKIIEPFAGLRAGYVYVEHAGEKKVENLRAVLDRLTDLPAELQKVRDLLSLVNALACHAEQLGADVATFEHPLRSQLLDEAMVEIRVAYKATRSAQQINAALDAPAARGAALEGQPMG